MVVQCLPTCNGGRARSGEDVPDIYEEVVRMPSSREDVLEVVGWW